MPFGEEELIPAEYVNRMIDGENKIKVWRDFRGMTAKALDDAAGLSAPYGSQIESGTGLTMSKSLLWILPLAYGIM
ncbi:hypothetical protein LQT97_14380 [Brucella pseudogrignonensis]|jgi:transcriptional regulator with XRE-family HTH domain|uniref:hypothetical protein n=1 Tax=Brucella pseudogrignonensis TaxID=419475 RepID=UPI001E3138CF|nr:hypothetical protein [Brucella pseudogrignonensis]MCD4512411.1 hypothetical protein [Brucella pseudogrignonensis]